MPSKLNYSMSNKLSPKSREKQPKTTSNAHSRWAFNIFASTQGVYSRGVFKNETVNKGVCDQTECRLK